MDLINSIGLFKIIILIFLGLGIFLIVKALRLPGNFFKNQDTMSDIRKKIKKREKESE